MPISRSFQNDGQYLLTDLTDAIQVIPNEWGLLGRMGVFSQQGVAQNTVTMEQVENTIGVIGSSPRGTRDHMVNKDDLSKILSFHIPHFQIADRIEPQDIQGRRRVGTADQPDTLMLARQRKLERMQKSAGITKEYMRMQAIKGDIVTASGEQVSNLYTDFGVSQKEVDFVLGTTTTKVGDKIEEVIAHIQDNLLTGDIIDDIVVLCSPEFFQKLVSHSKVEEAYKFYNNTNQAANVQILRDRLGSGLYRTFSHQGLVFVEYRGTYNVNGTPTPLVGANDAYAMPVGVGEMFVEYNGPADHLDFVNTLGEPLFAFEHRDPRGFYHEIFVEFNTLPLIRRPQAVVKCTTSS